MLSQSAKHSCLQLYPFLAAVGIDFLSQSLPILLPLTEQGVLDAMLNLSVSERLLSPLPVSPPVCTNVSIIDDDILELVQTKTFHLNLSHADSQVLLTAPSTVTVTITDNDSEFTTLSIELVVYSIEHCSVEK